VSEPKQLLEDRDHGKNDRNLSGACRETYSVLTLDAVGRATCSFAAVTTNTSAAMPGSGVPTSMGHESNFDTM
jgi:hypothetical protein